MGSTEDAAESSSTADAEVSLDDLDMDFELPDLDGDEAMVTDEADATFIMDADEAAGKEAESDVAGLDAIDLGSTEDAAESSSTADAEVSLDDLDMDFELPDLDGDEAMVTDEAALGVNADNSEVDEHDLDASIEGEEIGLLTMGAESIDSLDSGMDDLDISTTNIDSTNLGLIGNDEVVENEVDMFADLDADLTELELHEESIVSHVNELNTDEETESENKGDVLSVESEDLDKTFILNDVAKNKAMLDEGSNQEEPVHFSDIDAALAGASSVDDDPMIDAFISTEELENVHINNSSPVDTVGVSAELDELMKDLDNLLDEDKDKT